MPRPSDRPSLTARRWTIAALAALAALVSACAGTQTPPDRLDEPPDDFALAVTVYGPETGRREIEALPRPVRPSRYIVEPDRVLRAAVGPGSDFTTYPPMTRQLSAREMAQLWRLVRDRGLLDPNHPARADTTATFTPPPNRRMTTLFASFGDTRRYLQVYIDRESEPADAAVELTDRLAELAWVRP